MDSFEDLSKSFKAALYERGQSPFYLAFILSWIGWNWKFIVYLFFDNPNSSETIAEKLCFISNNYINICSNLWNPLWTSLVVFLAGNILTLIFLVIKNYYNKIKRKHIDGIEPFDKEKEKAVREELLKEEIRNNRMLTEKIAETESHKTTIQELNKKILSIETENIELKKILLENNDKIEKLQVQNMQKDLNNNKPTTIFPPVSLDEDGIIINENTYLQKEYETFKNSPFYNSFLTYLFIIANEKTTSFARDKLVRFLDNRNYSQKEGYRKFDDLSKIEVVNLNEKYDVCNLSEKGKTFAELFIKENNNETVGFNLKELSNLIK